MKLKSSTSNRPMKPGYLLIEGLVSVLISVFAIWTIIVMITYTRNSQNQNIINFHSYLSLVESDRFRFEIVKQNPVQCALYSPVTKKRYRIEQYQDMIRLTGQYQGHVPALTGIRQARWSRDRGCLRTDVIFENGQKCSAYSKIPFKNWLFQARISDGSCCNFCRYFTFLFNVSTCCI